jgi:hypothetical protein
LGQELDKNAPAPIPAFSVPMGWKLGKIMLILQAYTVFLYHQPHLASRFDNDIKQNTRILAGRFNGLEGTLLLPKLTKNVGGNLKSKFRKQSLARGGIRHVFVT